MYVCVCVCCCCCCCCCCCQSLHCRNSLIVLFQFIDMTHTAPLCEQQHARMLKLYELSSMEALTSHTTVATERGRYRSDVDDSVACTALHLAARSGLIDCVQGLLAHGANYHVVNQVRLVFNNVGCLNSIDTLLPILGRRHTTQLLNEERWHHIRVAEQWNAS
jgi:hypothetical protein